MIKEGSFELAYQCLREFQYHFAKKGDTIIKYGDIGDKFYIIWKGFVDVYVPVEKRVDFNSVELAKLIDGYREMIVSINGVTSYTTPYLTKYEISQYTV